MIVERKGTQFLVRGQGISTGWERRIPLQWEDDGDVLRSLENKAGRSVFT